MSRYPRADLPARGWILGIVTLLVLVFPCLMAGRGIDTPARADEVARLALAIEDPDGDHGGPAVLFYAALLPARASQAEADHLDEFVPMARLASVLGILTATVLLYLCVMLARGRTQALIACLCFGLMPAVASSGYVLRPEIPVTIFGLLGLVILQSLPTRLASRRTRSLASRAALASAYALAVGTAFALAAVSLSWYGIYLIVPGGCLLLCILLSGFRFIRAVRRQPTVIPLLPLFVRVAPWFLIAAFSLVVMAAAMASFDAIKAVTQTEAGLWPEGWWAAGALLVFGGCGAIIWVWRAGLLMGRWRRLTADVVLLVFCVTMLLQRRLLPEGADALPAAGPLSVFVAEGIVLAMVLARRAVSRRSNKVRSSS